MKKTFLFLAALAMSAMTWATEQTLTFDLSKNPGGWPTANSTELTEYTYTLGDVDYSFYLKNVKCNSGYLMLTQPAALGLPAIEGYKLTKVVAKNTSGCSTSVNVGISYSSESAEYLSGGEAQKWATQSSSYTYELDETSDNVVYYLYVTNKNAQVTELELTYTSGVTPQRTLQSIYIDGTATKLEYFEGESFDVDGLKVMGKYDSGDDTEITAGIEWTIVPGTLALGTTSVDVTAQYKDFTSEVFTVNDIVVKQFVKTYANTYTSNVEYTPDSKIIWDDVEYDALKMAKNTPATITVPANTKNLHIHAAAWNKEGCEWTISGLTDDVKITTTADAGVAGNSPFTLQNDPETTDYFVISTNNSEAKEITITLPKDKRGVIFGINAELQEGIVAAPTFTPTESEFDGSVEVTLSAEEGAVIYYTLDATTPTDASTKYESAFTLTATTTVKAIAIKDGKNSEVAEKTYTLIPVFESLEALVTEQPATETNVTVIVTITEAQIDSFYVTSKGQTNGVYTHVGTTVVELYAYDVPEAWQVGGTLSATTLKAQWGLYKGTAELQQWENGWNAFTYTAPQPTGINNAKANAKATKAVVNGQFIIIRDNVRYNVAGQQL